MVFLFYALAGQNREKNGFKFSHFNMGLYGDRMRFRAIYHLTEKNRTSHRQIYVGMIDKTLFFRMARCKILQAGQKLKIFVKI